LDEATILAKLSKASGANYDAGSKNQGSSKLVPTSVAQGREQASMSNAKTKIADKSDYNKKDESAQVKKKKKEQRRQQIFVFAFFFFFPLNETLFSFEQFWTQKKEEEKAAPPRPAPVKTVPQGGNTAAAKSRFENPPPQQAPPPVKRAPAAAAPPPPAPAKKPEPEPEPEPEPQQTYEEPQQTYEEPQQTYEEPQQTYEEPPQQTTAGLYQVKALYDYDAENPDDLNFREGDIINVLDDTDPSGWFKVRRYCFFLSSRTHTLIAFFFSLRVNSMEPLVSSHPTLWNLFKRKKKGEEEMYFKTRQKDEKKKEKEKESYSFPCFEKEQFEFCLSLFFLFFCLLLKSDAC
jgi:hypothetical protein